jgi:phosphohistidine phosphatase
MDLILWRHAEARDGEGALAGSKLDMARELTVRGERQARRMAQWLDRQLVDTARVYTSPAVRAERTAHALNRKYKVTDELAPLSTPQQLLSLAQWPEGKSTVLLIGHQPTLGMTIARLLNLSDEQCAVRKGSLWWLRCKEREGSLHTQLMAVQAPDFL